MANETLKIILTAENRDALQGLKETIKGLDGVTVASGKATGAVGKNTQAWMNWGRVVQDAPYGLNGIANNLTQVIPSIGALGFAFSGLIAAMTFAQVGFGAWTRGLTQAKEETDKFNKELAQERTQLNELYRTATNANVPLEARKKAIKDLRSDYGNYLKDFSDEAILAGKAESAYRALTSAIVANAKAQAARDKIAKIAQQQLEIEAKMAEVAENARKKAADNAARLQQRGDISLRQQELTGGIQSTTTTFNEATNAIRKLVAEYEQLNVQIKVLEGTIDANTVKPLTDGIKTANYASTEWENTLKRINLQLQGTKNLGQQGFIDRSPTGMINTMAKPAVPPPNPYNIPEIRQSELRQEALKNEIALMQQQAATLTNLVAPAFENLFAAFVNGQDIGQAFIDTLKSILIELAKMVIKALLFKIIFSAIKNSNPATAGLDAGQGGAGLFGAIGGGLNIIGLLRGNDIALALDRTGTSYGYRRGG